MSSIMVQSFDQGDVSHPLVIDLDGSLVHTDLLYESYFATATTGLPHHISVLKALAAGKASLKAVLAERCRIAYDSLPYNEAVLKMIGEAKRQGRRVYLATASNRRHAEAIAAHLGLFDGVFASDDDINLKGTAKARVLVEAFGKNGFDYVGNSAADKPVWTAARKAYCIGSGAWLQKKMKTAGVALSVMDSKSADWRVWLKALRVHQYAKNLLVFVPLLTAHAFEPAQVMAAMLAFVAFSLCASGVYLLNDLIDIEADRKHPTKRHRPLANGTIPIIHGVIAIPILISAAFAVALSLSLPFAGILAVYLALTTLYSLVLKRKLLIDVVTLALLYTLRILGGAAAIEATVSEWLLAFSMFTFLCLALVKRHVELARCVDQNLPDPVNRNYRGSDLPVVAGLAAASGFNAVTIFTLYISASETAELYSNAQLLWAISPILLYWFGRLIIMVHRRLIDDDPIVFAITDRVSYLVAGTMVAVVLMAT